ncbi:MAG: diguanylate cyclase domain-containing protein [Acidimicrobiales bacterium]
MNSGEAGPGHVTPGERLVEFAPNVMMLVDDAGVIQWVGGALRRLSGYEPTEVVGTNVMEWIDRSWNPVAVESIAAAMAGKGPQRPMLFRVFRKDRSTFVAEVQANSQWHDPDVNAMAVYIRPWDEQMLLNEVVEHIASRAPLESTLKLVSKVTSAETLSGAGVLLFEPMRGICSRSVTAFDLPTALRSDSESLRAPWRTAINSGSPSWAKVEDLEESLRSEAEAAGYSCCWAWPVTASEQNAGCLVVWRPSDEEPDHTSRMLLDNLVRITGLVLEREQQEDRLRHSATHDPLTQLANRARFFEHLQDALDGGAGPRVGVLYIDLDRFKPVNDTLGHGVGDQVLRAVARRLVASVREGEMVARLGGDEFAVLCPAVGDETMLKAVASRISNSIAQPIIVGDERIEIGASVGVAHAAPGSCSIDVLIDAADTALYAVKANGRGGWQIGPLGR